jgi:hypothetical protein
MFRSLDAVGVDGQFVRIPTDFGPGPTLVLLEHSDRADAQSGAPAWLPIARRLAATVAPLEYVVALMIDHSGPAELSFEIDTGYLYGRFDAEQVRARTVRLLESPDSLRSELGLAAGVDVFAFLVADGEVVWRADGLPTPALQQSLEAVHAVTTPVAQPVAWSARPIAVEADPSGSDGPVP